MRVCRRVRAVHVEAFLCCTVCYRIDSQLFDGCQVLRYVYVRIIGNSVAGRLMTTGVCWSLAENNDSEWRAAHLQMYAESCHYTRSVVGIH